MEYSKFTVSEPKLKLEGRKLEMEVSTFVASDSKMCGVAELLAAACNNKSELSAKKFDDSCFIVS